MSNIFKPKNQDFNILKQAETCVSVHTCEKAYHDEEDFFLQEVGNETFSAKKKKVRIETLLLFITFFTLNFSALKKKRFFSYFFNS